MEEIICLRELDLDNKKVFIRCDFNCPQDEFLNITDDRRIAALLPTLRYCLDHNCAIILASHLGRPKERSAKYSLAPMAKRLSQLLKHEVKMAKSVVGEDAFLMAKELGTHEIMLLENLRFEKGELTNDPSFAKTLSSMADFYINDAFGVCHREHASVSAITQYFDAAHKAVGFLLLKEINFATNLMKRPTRPFVAVVGGSKVSGKLQALNNLVTKVDKLIIGGGMAFTFLKAQGIDIGDSLIEEDLIKEARHILQKAKDLGVKTYLPVDLIVAQSITQDAVIRFVPIQEISAGWMGLDIGPASVRLFKEVLFDAQTIWWNGPMGVFEIDKFSKGSIKMSHYISESHATKVVGGGDTADVVNRAGDTDEMTFISTGGGASLELIEGKELPSLKPFIRKMI